MSKYLLVSLLVFAPYCATAAQVFVDFAFTGFSGPFARSTEADRNDPTKWIAAGTVDGSTPTAQGWVELGDSGPDPLGYVTGSSSISRNHQFGAPASVDFGVAEFGAEFANNFTFTPAANLNVLLGQTFTLGTLSFTNGAWSGAGITPAFDTPSVFDFVISTVSPGDSSAFTQTLAGSITLVSHASDSSTPAGMDADADWVYFTAASGGSVSASMGSFRVYDIGAIPPGFTNQGSVDVIARFGSLDLIAFANPRGGFVVDSIEPLPPVPEPATWVLLGLGLAGLRPLAARRRGSAAA